MRILIVGGTGFIGPHVVRRLAAKGHEVTVFHRGRTEADLPPEVAHLHGDRAQLPEFRDELRRLAPEVVLDMRPINAQEARTLREAFAGQARRAVALSSGDVYRAYGVLRRTEPGPPDPVPLAEDAPLRRKLYPYRGPSPRAADDPMRWADDYDKILVERVIQGDPTLPGTVLRLPMVYGPGDEARRLFPYLKRMDDRRPAIVLDEGMARWRWTRGYVEDVAAAVVAAVVAAVLYDRAAGRVYNVGEPHALSEADWVRAIARAAGWDGEVVTAPAGRLPAGPLSGLNWDQDIVTDTSRIRAELGYTEAFSLDEALARTVAWERAHPPATIDPRAFDYAAEDAILAERHSGR
jgi:nucleoside-diphosphate-sugar epimerase